MENINIDDRFKIKDEFFRFISFWPIYLIFLITSVSLAYFYLRYTDYEFESNAKIEIFDKAQDSEMALPTAMTVFNRSMINLENEKGVLNSFSLHEKVVDTLNANVKFYSVGTIKTTENHITEWMSDYDLKFKIDTDTISSTSAFRIEIIDSKLSIDVYKTEERNFIKNISFNGMSSLESDNDLPFDLTINKYDDDDEFLVKELKLLPKEAIVDSFKDAVRISEDNSESDQLNISLRYSNKKIANDYINKLMYEFDRDGIIDRQLEYKRTMDFADSRSGFLLKELEKIEIRRKEFKEKNKLSDIKMDADINVNQKYNYDSELFSAKSQKDLTSLLQTSLNGNEMKMMPVNIGIENISINQLIEDYNFALREMERYLVSAGSKNSFVINLENQLEDYRSNILISIENYQKSLDVTISNLESKEKEFSNLYKNIPENEKILRSIERELEVKEALFLLLLQKREEAAINYAVVKPSIKIIDSARSLEFPVSPNKIVIYVFSVILGFLIPTSFLYIWFITDTKIHTREKLIDLTNNIPIIGELPFINDKNIVKTISETNSRNPLVESIRMLIANLNFVLFNKKNLNNVILVTSSIKGEGKTIVSVNTASLISAKYNKVILIGADLRNPQIHKFLDVDKSTKGLSDYIYKDNLEWKKLILKRNNLDILLSGTIPPNPTSLLSSDKFANLINEIKSEYDYVIIDSAPCLLVSDTFEISKYVDTTLYIVRSNFSEIKLCDFINECKNQEKLKGLCLVLNGLGNSGAYGYKYGYQYGYKYGYKYSYNYGYGYGYSEDKTK